MRRIRRSLLLRGNHLLPANVHGILTAEFARDLLERLFHTRAILWPRKSDEGLVHKLRNLRFRLSSRHLRSPKQFQIQFYCAPRRPDKTGGYTYVRRDVIEGAQLCRFRLAVVRSPPFPLAIIGGHNHEISPHAVTSAFASERKPGR